MKLVFDLDGTLVSTREANLAAYRSIGVEPPENFHVRTWQSWCTHESHERKQDALPQFADRIRKLPLSHLFIRATVRNTNNLSTFILSNASRRSFSIIFQAFPFLGQARTFFIEYDQEKKLSWLRDNGPGIYFDDDLHFVDTVRSRLRNWEGVWSRELNDV